MYIFRVGGAWTEANNIIILFQLTMLAATVYFEITVHESLPNAGGISRVNKSHHLHHNDYDYDMLM